MADEIEQQLRDKIASQKAAIAELPSLKSIVDQTGLTSPETKSRAQRIKELSDNEKLLELLLESNRVEAVVKLQDELHPPENSGDCSICLETVRFYCCGGWICYICGEEREANGKKDDTMFSNKCPLCRESLHTDGKEAGAMVLGRMLFVQAMCAVFRSTDSIRSLVERNVKSNTGRLDTR